MDDVTMQKEWDRFSGSIGGQVDKVKENFANPDNVYRIIADTNTIELTWENRPQKGRGSYVLMETLFSYQLNNSETVNLKVYPTGFLSTVFSLFTGRRRKTGIKELDESYIFLSTNESLIFDLTEEFKLFCKKNTYRNFTIEIETITGKPTLRIFIPELLTTQEKLKFYYNFGQRVASIIEGKRVYNA